MFLKATGLQSQWVVQRVIDLFFSMNPHTTPLFQRQDGCIAACVTPAQTIAAKAFSRRLPHTSDSL